MSSQYRELPPNSSWDLLASLGHPSKFQRVSRLGFITAATSLTGGQPNFARCMAVSWPGTLYIHFRDILPPDGILPRVKFTFCPSTHHRTSFSGYIFATKACVDNRKKLTKQQCVLQMSPQYGELRPTSGWDRSGILGHPCKFQLVSHLGSVTARHVVVGVSETLRRWTEGATYIRQGGHHVGHRPTF